MDDKLNVTKTLGPASSLAGRKLARYQILEKVGEGGMGVVYKAQDTRLERTVALKIINSQSLQGEEAQSRFLREAKAGAALNHPSICTIYEASEAEGILYLSMEYVDGQSLKKKIEERPLPLVEALDIAIQVAEGLAAAHKKGIVHRDIKPGNILLNREGRAVVLDFGLAQMLGSAQVTQTGMVMGTPAYMAPEQLEGDKADERADVWALGILLYEMLGGRPPFQNKSGHALALQILHQDPEPLTAIRTGIPIEIDQILSKALAKNPSERYQHADELLVDLQLLKKKVPTLTCSLGTKSMAKRKPGRAWPRPLPWALASVVILAALVLWGPWRPNQAESQGQVMRFVVSLPEGDSFQGVGIGGSAIDLSPDGTEVVYAARRGKVRELFRRSLSDLEPTPVPDTQGAVVPILSRDLSWITFASGRQVKRVHAEAGASTVLGTSEDSMRMFDVDIAFFGGCWLDGKDLLVSECTRGLRLYSLDSGQKSEITDVFNSPKEDERQHQFPQVLPGGKWVLFTIWNTPEDSSIAVRSIESGEQRVILKPGSYARYSPSGHIVYAWEGNLYAAPFDLRRMEVTGVGVKVVEGVMMQETRGAAHFSLSENGTLAYIPGPYIKYNQTLVLIDRRGEVREAGFPSFSQNTQNIRLSPDGKMALVSRVPDSGPNPEIWIYELERGVSRPLTNQKSESYWAIWTPKGNEVIYAASTNRLQDLDMYLVASDGSGPAEMISSPDETWHFPYSLDSQAKLLAFQKGKETNYDIWLLPMEGDRNPYPLLQAGYDEVHPAISPDGRWLAYSSNESGRFEVKIRPLSGAGAVVQVSSGGGWEPVWSADGKALYFRNLAGNHIMAAAIGTDANLQVGKPELLIENNGLVGGRMYGRNFDISADGKQFLAMTFSPPPPPPTRYVVVVNWADELARLVPHKS